MSSVNSQIPMDRIADVLGSVRKKNVRLWSENGELHYKAPKGALTQDEIERLRVSRCQIVAILEGANGAQTTELKPGPAQELRRAPLTFSQLTHWHLYGLSERKAIRQIASATRLRGRLKVDVLQRSIAEIVQRHDALRTRIVVLDGVPIQEIVESDDCELKVDDLTALAGSSREAEVIRLVEQHILEPIDVGEGPLFGLRLLRLGEEEHVLIVAMEHMISDEASMSILLRDLFTSYTQALKGRALCLPAMPVQFADYAVWQRSAEKSWSEKHGEYWNERLNGCPRLAFPVDTRLPAPARLGWGRVPVRIAKDLKAELREWCRVRRTTVVMSVFTAYVGIVLRWCNASEAVVRYQSDGRVGPEVENTIGYFASALCLRLRLLEGDSFVDLMNRVTSEYCKAYEHADFSYMSTFMPHHEFSRNTIFNWVPQGSGMDLSGLNGSADAITCSPIRFAHPMARTLELDIEPFVLLFETEDEIVGDVYFPLNRFSIDTMERFGRNFLRFIEGLLVQPQRPVRDIVLV